MIKITICMFTRIMQKKTYLKKKTFGCYKFFICFIFIYFPFDGKSKNCKIYQIKILMYFKTGFR